VIRGYRISSHPSNEFQLSANHRAISGRILWYLFATIADDEKGTKRIAAHPSAFQKKSARAVLLTGKQCNIFAQLLGHSPPVTDNRPSGLIVFGLNRFQNCGFLKQMQPCNK
jgi:hypothetical protein